MYSFLVMGNSIQSLLFQPPEPSYQSDPNLIYLTTRRNQRIACFHLNKKAPLTILFSHGNAEDLGYVLDYFRQIFPNLNANVFAYDYTGYGLSSGTPSEDDVYADIEASFLYLRDVKGVPWSSLVLFGRSLGTAASIHLASLTPICGIILQCPMLSVFRIAFNSRFTFPGDQLVSVDRIGCTTAPVLVVHGTRDEIVPFWHGREIYNLCRNKKVDPFWVQNGLHNDIETIARTEFVERVSSFLAFLTLEELDKGLLTQSVLI